jgi:hypothetical protein
LIILSAPSAQAAHIKIAPFTFSRATPHTYTSAVNLTFAIGVIEKELTPEMDAIKVIFIGDSRAQYHQMFSKISRILTICEN